jgi:hypothetical protein
VNRPRPKRELEVRVMFEPNRFTERYLTVAYERVVPIRRRSISMTEGKPESNNRKVARRAGGTL